MVSTIRKQTLLLAAACSAAAALAAAGFILDNRRVDAGEVTVRISTLPAGLDGLRIAHLSDLHYPKCARSPQALAELVESLEPDLIVLTGDLMRPLTGRSWPKRRKGWRRSLPATLWRGIMSSARVRSMNGKRS